MQGRSNRAAIPSGRPTVCRAKTSPRRSRRSRPTANGEHVSASITLIGAVDDFTLSTMPAHDAKKDVVTHYSQPAEMSGTGEIIDSVVHIHATMAVADGKGLSGHLHRAAVKTWFA